MAYKELFFVQVFEYGPKDRLMPGRHYEVKDAEEAKRKAKYLADRVPAGVIAFSQMVDKEAQDAEEPILLACYGHVPPEARAQANVA